MPVLALRKALSKGFLLPVIVIGLGMMLSCLVGGRRPARPETCEVHHVPLENARLPVYYNLNIEYHPEFYKACGTLFPHAPNLVSKPSRFAVFAWFDRHDNVAVCPKCVEARKNWKPSVNPSATPTQPAHP